MAELLDGPFGVLPPGLPPGRLIVPDEGDWPGGPVMWVSDEPVPDAAALWTRLHESHPETGFYPLLLKTLRDESDRPWHSGELFPPASVGAIDVLEAGGVLQRFWEWVSEELPEDAGEGVQVDGNGVPRGPWPGLAPAGPPGGDPDKTAREHVLACHVGDSVLLGLVPAGRGADALTRMGWSGPCNHTDHTQEISAVVRSWEDRFGARVTSVGFATLDLSVAAPPATLDQAIEIAVEHHAFCPDNVRQGCGDLTRYAESLVDAEHWSFWWD
ncbi:DUF4253 domain-containing protein [Thermomonospora cellulosilytica]|uniref:DUF4253 domain-containing protein n=1 Tax=Thermomonospora cellulosilytica TaxID=1411118 RepID=A0A7W3RC79_9ACTN|nr:DUF4253 domain-containing protein [Thermomonospora cellulosilytica]MBA9007574.1 hypothetical protein [Thermomonospora cellulosilytica]